MEREPIYYIAKSEGGDVKEDPSEDALYMMIEDLTHPDNTYVIIEPDEEDSTWFASVAVLLAANQLEDGRYEVEYRDTLHREHRVTVENDLSHIAKETTIWLAHHAVINRKRRS